MSKKSVWIFAFIKKDNNDRCVWVLKYNKVVFFSYAALLFTIHWDYYISTEYNDVCVPYLNC